jgi:hypothetical protein
MTSEDGKYCSGIVGGPGWSWTTKTLCCCMSPRSWMPDSWRASNIRMSCSSDQEPGTGGVFAKSLVAEAG